MSAIKRLSAKVWVINATEEAQKMGSAMFANSFRIGALVAVRILPLDNESIEPVLKETFPREIDVNILAFRRGMELVRLG
jgi:Pyruvate/2-oxoacid:ferredoxin oxidoreductase gamma subunit